MDETTAHFGVEQILSLTDFWEVIVLGTLLTPRNVFVVFPAWFLVRAVEHALPDRGRARSWLLRLRELLYIGICSVLVWAPGLRPEIESWGFRLGLGFTLAFVTTLVPWSLHLVGAKFGVDAFKDPRRKATSRGKPPA